MAKNRVFLYCFLTLTLIVFISLLPIPLMVNAAKYAQVGREIVDNGDWINLTIGGMPYDQKPPMLFWIAAICFKFFGMSIPLYKVAVMLVSVLGAYSTFRLGTLFYGRNVGRLACFFWISSLAFWHFQNDIHTDTILTSFVIFSVWQFMEYFRMKKWYNFVLGVLGIGFSMLSKGPVGLIIPGVAIGSNLILQKQWKEIFHWRWILAVLLIGLIISPALIGLFRQFGADGIKFYFWTNNIGRVTGSYHRGNNDYSFYIHTSLYLLLPWSIFMLIAMGCEIKSLFRINKKNVYRREIANITGVIFFVVILSISKQKNPHYLLSVIPFIFIITAKWCSRIFHEAHWGKLARIITIINKVVALLIFGVIPIVSMYFFHETKIWFWAITVLLALGVIFMAIRQLNFKAQLTMLMTASTALIFTLNASLLPHMLTFHSSIKAAKLFNKEKAKEATLNSYKATEWDLFLYADHYGKFLTTRQELETLLPGTNNWVYTSEAGYKEMQKMGVHMQLIKKYPRHKKVTHQSLNFLKPKTRVERFRTIYLVELK